MVPCAQRPRLRGREAGRSHARFLLGGPPRHMRLATCMIHAHREACRCNQRRNARTRSERVRRGAERHSEYDGCNVRCPGTLCPLLGARHPPCWLILQACSTCSRRLCLPASFSQWCWPPTAQPLSVAGQPGEEVALDGSLLVLHLALVTYTVRLHQLPALYLGVVLGLARESPDISVCLPVLLRGWGWTDTL